MLIKANHAPLFLVNSYYPCFTLALTNDSARLCESLGVVGMQTGGAAFRSPHQQVHLEIGFFTPAQVENVINGSCFANSQKYIILDSFFFSTAVVTCTKQNSRSGAKAPESSKS